MKYYTKTIEKARVAFLSHLLTLRQEVEELAEAVEPEESWAEQQREEVKHALNQFSVKMDILSGSATVADVI